MYWPRFISTSRAYNYNSTLSQYSGIRTMTTITGDSTQVFRFSSGNPRVKETRGVMHLYRDDFASQTSELPVGRKTIVCVLGVPNHITYADFCQFCSSSIQHMLEMRIVRNDGMQDKYSVLIRFDDQSSTDAFYERFNGKHFSPPEVEACHVLFTLDVQYTGSIEHAQSTPASSTEQPSCPVCLKRLDEDTSGVFTTICNHSFHFSCISKWTDSSCPVCQYCQQQPEKSICFVCQTSENLWSCVFCGFVGCGREGHAITHWKDTQHSYSLELDTQRVWDYVGDDYAHPLIESKTDVDPGFSEALLNSQVETIVNEYRELLTTQLENQKIWASLVHGIAFPDNCQVCYDCFCGIYSKETEREISEAVGKAVDSQKFQNMQDKLNRYVEEKGFLDKVNENLLKNLEILMAKDEEIKAREKKDLKEKDNIIQKLEEQLGQLMVCLETGNAD